jgi:hypothetical protein
MQAAVLAPNFYSALAISVLFLHALYILWVVFGALLTRSRPMLRWLHIASLVWGILTELLPWPCPLTLLENWLERNAGVDPDQGGFLLHYLDKLVYPDIPSTMLTTAAVIICTLNLAYYGRQAWIAGRAGPSD